jgi:cytochrome c553
MRVSPSLAIAALLLESVASRGTLAQQPATASPDQVAVPAARSPAILELADRQSIERGRAVAVGVFNAGPSLGGATRQACMNCHGMDGRGDGSAAFPRLTGQSAWYMYKQLLDYASGSRPNSVMSPIASALNEQQMQDVALYYSVQEAPTFPPRDHDPLLVQEGGALSAVGSTARQIPACINCHGPGGSGLPPVFPYLAGQYGGYTRLQLELWQRDIRRNDPLDVMAAIAKSMTARDVEAVAAYFESVPRTE